MQQVADDLRKHPQRAEDAGKWHAFPDLEQVDVDERLPDRLRVCVDNGCDLVGDVVDREEVVRKHGENVACRVASTVELAAVAAGP